MLQKLKSFLTNDTTFYSALLVIVALASFGLGRWSEEGTTPENKPVLSLESMTPAAVSKAVAEASTTPSKEDLAKKTPGVIAVVGSKSGTKYHLPDCPGAKRIKPENLITFETVEKAKAAGYTPAANCPGLQ